MSREGHSTTTIAQIIKVPYSTVAKWLHSDEAKEGIVRSFALCHTGKRGGQTALGKQKKGKYDRAERELFAQLKAKRAAGRRVSPKWLSITMKTIVGDDLLSASHFDYHWRRRFYVRFNLATRKRTNKKSLNMEQRMIKWSSYHERFRAFMQSGPLQCTKYGRYSPENRYMFIFLHVLLLVFLTIIAFFSLQHYVKGITWTKSLSHSFLLQTLLSKRRARYN